MPHRTARANPRKSAVRAAVEHVFARQKGPMGLINAFLRKGSNPAVYFIRAMSMLMIAKSTFTQP